MVLVPRTGLIAGSQQADAGVLLEDFSVADVADIPAIRALRVLDATGKLLTPGLIDLHCHVFPYGSAIGIPADELVAHQCTTTCVSGDAGANNFAAFRRYVVACRSFATISSGL